MSTDQLDGLIGTQEQWIASLQDQMEKMKRLKNGGSVVSATTIQQVAKAQDDLAAAVRIVAEAITKEADAQSS